MYNECRHIMPSGARCHAPSLHGKPCCYFHTKVHRQSAPKGPFDDLSIKFPVLEDRRAIQLALTQVLEAVAASRLDPRRAGLLLYGLQIAAQITPATSFALISPVRTVHQEGEELELAPEEAVCEPPEDCRNCPKAETCDDFMEDDDEDGDPPHPRNILSLLGCAEQASSVDTVVIPSDRREPRDPHVPDASPATNTGCPRSRFWDLGYHDLHHPERPLGTEGHAFASLPSCQRHDRF